MDMISASAVGGEGLRGSKWDEKGRGEVAQNFVSYKDNRIVISLQFLFFENGNLVLSKPHGYGYGHGSNFNAVVLDYPSEFLTSIRGSFGSWDGYSVLNSISFGTNKGSYGPFGGTPSADDSDRGFNFQIGNYRSFGGFYGSTNKYGIESIGVYVKTITTSMINSKDSSV
ncbi:PREDICTED: jacalin-related lectin 2-like [Nicotiana attenuata]|uniref:Jacalin-related lectin 2 n=1 Tax=Nicotiana attenuata TaxID=49451 RepID=A0A1J6K260_NICAT|nr:PREDICTED: jacalin-related lectin 2-like [Nicotiana attenuata]OIT22724.1 jacalin-related lectin 2 [Nicotiana attenuata]